MLEIAIAAVAVTLLIVLLWSILDERDRSVTAPKTKGELQWYVSWYPDCDGWAVMLGVFRDSWFIDKEDANRRRDELNAAI